MKRILIVVLIAMLSASSAYAAGGPHGGGWSRGGWGWGGVWIVPALAGGVIGYDLAYPYYYPYYPYPVYAAPAPVYTQPAPTYEPSPAASAGQYWYYCESAKGYYPYVASCPVGWQAVPATPPAQR